MSVRCCRLLMVALLFSIGWVSYASAAPAPVSDAKDPDFQIQGEYQGDIETPEGAKRIGVQVIALGEGKFRAVGYVGGLPGAGWEGLPPIASEGALDGAVAKFHHDLYDSTLSGGTLSITSAGLKLADLKKVVRESPTLGAKPPSGAVVLFDGTNADEFEKGRMTDDGLLQQGVTSKKKFQSCTLHIEFVLPFMPAARGQGRGNSGCYLQGRYEVQVLDSFGLSGENNECGGIYEISKPSVNMCFPPLSWQTYDIDYTTATYDGDKKLTNAKMTVRHNGVVIQKDVELPRATRASPVKEGSEPGPIYLQDHGNPVRYRNIWVVETK